MHACVAKKLAPSRSIRNQASHAVDSFFADELNNEFQLLKTFKNEKKEQNDAEGEKRMKVEERH